MKYFAAIQMWVYLQDIIKRNKVQRCILLSHFCEYMPTHTFYMLEFFWRNPKIHKKLVTVAVNTKGK